MIGTRPELILFDLDGTLIDSLGDLRTALNVLLGELGRPSLAVADVRPMIGDGVAKLVERALVARPGDDIALSAAVARFLEIYEAAPATLTRPYPGAADTLARLVEAGIRLAVCTNKPERVTLLVLRTLGLDRYFDRIVGGDSLPWRKPDRRLVASILDGFGIGGKDALFVGDSEVDAATAEAAGVRFVLMTNGYRRGPIEAIPHDAALDRFTALIPLVLGAEAGAS